jgi:hypothetical protein
MTEFTLKENELIVTFKNGRRATFNVTRDSNGKTYLDLNGVYLDGNKESCVATYDLETEKRKTKCQ